MGLSDRSLEYDKMELSKEEFLLKKRARIRAIKEGKIVLYPTDTIYGLGCSAADGAAVRKLRAIKGSKGPFSVIAPSKEWIEENCIIDSSAKEWLAKLPGPYTLILALKQEGRKAIAKEVNPGKDSLGVRIPKHWISKFVEELGLPLVTTSANVLAENHMTRLEDLDDRIRAKIDLLVYEGPKEGHPSTLIDLTKPKAEITKR